MIEMDSSVRKEFPLLCAIMMEENQVSYQCTTKVHLFVGGSRFRDLGHWRSSHYAVIINSNIQCGKSDFHTIRNCS